MRLLNLDADGPHDALTDVLRGIVFLEEFLEGLYDSFPECRKVSSAVTGVLTVDKRENVLPVTVTVGEDNFYVLAFQMNRGI